MPTSTPPQPGSTPRKISIARALRMTEQQITAAIFRGASSSDFRGPSDAFTLPAMQAVLGREDLSTAMWGRFCNAVDASAAA